MRLTDINVRSLPAPEKGQKAYPDETLRGFAVRVSQGGVKTFTLVTGKDRQRITIGRYPTIGLAEARGIAKAKLAERTLSKHRPTRIIFTNAIALFVAEKAQKNRQATVDENKRLLTKYYPLLQKKPVADITTDDITRQLDKLSDTPGTSLHAFWAMRLFMRWCVKRRYIQHSPIEGLDAPSQTIQRERVLSDDELRTVWRATEMLGGTFSDIVKLLILTGQRRGEIASLKGEWCIFENVDVAQSVEHGMPAKADHTGSEVRALPSTICLPSTITKNKRTHTFPLGVLTASIIGTSLVGKTECIFPARGSLNTPFNGWSKAKAQLDKKVVDQFLVAQKLVSWTLHDLRRTYVTNLQRLKVPLEVREALVNHISGESRSGVAGVYNRHKYWDEMVDAVDTFETWFKATILQWEEL